MAGCTGDADNIELSLAPNLISSLDGSTTLTALVAAGTTPLSGEDVHVSVVYTDRNGTPHDIAPIDGKTEGNGAFTGQIAGLTWDGTGTISVTSGAASASATFTVLDRTPPTVEILPPTTDLKVGPGLPLEVAVHVTDEIGISRVILDSNGTINNNTRETVVGSGSQDTTVTFRMSVPQNATTGPTIQLYALAEDLSGNISVATAITLTVDPAITIATPPGLMGSLLADGTSTQLTNPRAIGWSTRDSKLYIADATTTGACAPSCVWRMDPATGTIEATPIHVGTGILEGVAFDTTGDNLYITDRQNRITRLTWNGTTYATPTACVDAAQQQPQDPYHLVYDATLGILVVDDQDGNVQKIGSCASNSTGTAVSSQGGFDAPRGITLGPAGEIYVADNNGDRVSLVNRTTGARTAFAPVDAPYGMEWLTGGTSAFKDSLLVASQGFRTVESISSTAGRRSATYLRPTPIDLTVMNGTMYVLTIPSTGVTRGRVYKVTGF
jgi:hypothetical protein